MDDLPKPKPTPVEEFIREYNELTVKYGLQLTAIPNYKKRDDGTFSLVIQFLVSPLLKT